MVHTALRKLLKSCANRHHPSRDKLTKLVEWRLQSALRTSVNTAEFGSLGSESAFAAFGSNVWYARGPYPSI